VVVRDAGGWAHGCLKHQRPAPNYWGFATLAVTHSPVGCTRYIGAYRVFVVFATELGGIDRWPQA